MVGSNLSCRVLRASVSLYSLARLKFLGLMICHSSTSTIMLRTTIQLRMLGDEVSLAGEQAALGLTSTISDLAKLGQSILTSAVLPAATTRRWLKPFASASILPNAVGRPWEIDYYRASPADAIIDVYTKSGTVGKYSSYFGLVPSYDVGFAILAVDNGREAPDLDAYADTTLGGHKPCLNLFVAHKLTITQAHCCKSTSWPGPRPAVPSRVHIPQKPTAHSSLARQQQIPASPSFS